MKTLQGALFVVCRRSAFSACDLLATVGLVCVFAGWLVPAAVSKARAKAGILMCLNNLKQHGAAHSVLFQDGAIRSEPWPRLWMQQLQGADPGLKEAFCPSTAARPANRLFQSAEGGRVNSTWVVSGGQITNQGSYGFNGFFYLDAPLTSAKEGFKSPAMVTDPARTPVFADSVWVDFWPSANDRPARDLMTADNFSGSGLSRIAIPRHATAHSVATRNFDPANKLPGAVNLVFDDNHVETVGLEKLWGFSWHREWVSPAKRPGVP